MHPLQREIYHKMTPEQKLRVSLALYHSAYELKKAAVQKQYPDWERKTDPSSRQKGVPPCSYLISLIHHETGFRADVYLAGKDQLHHWGLKE